ncbi:MAG: diaminopimelate decarboxylase [Tissierellia bacterium]|nr:diaminopimelate decarboxylase [Tissierellia bacterium]
MKLLSKDIEIGGVSVQKLREEYGSPLYVYDVARLKENLQEVQDSFLSKYPKTKAAYAAKAFLCGALVDLLAPRGIHLDVVSGGELHLAMAKKFPGERIEFNGNNKSTEELVFALRYGVGTIIVDGMDELMLLDLISRELNTEVEVLFRVTPGVDAHTHEKIKTAKLNSKFGFAMGEVARALELTVAAPGLHFKGFHCHIGSQLFEVAPYLEAMEKLRPLFKLVEEITGAPIEELNMGGGFGIRYTTEERKPLSYFVDPIVEKRSEIFGEEVPVLALEPGRSIVGDAGYSLYTAGTIKRLEGYPSYLAVDGGMSDNIRPSLYGAEYLAYNAQRPLDEGTEEYTIVGKLCESGDRLIESQKLPPTESGDLLVMPSTGAYGYSMASNYNGMAIPGVVFVEDGEAREVVGRQSYEEMYGRDLYL